MQLRGDRWEWAVDAVAAVLFGGALGYAANGLGYAPPAAAGSLGAALALAALRSVPSRAGSLSLADFSVAALATPENEGHTRELVLTDDDRLVREVPAAAADELLLDDILAELGPESRVVRLFDPERAPTAGELQESIDRHLRLKPSRIPPDASQALSDALAELRRSLR